LLGAQLDTGKDQLVIAGKSYPYGPCTGRRVARLRCNKAVTLKPRETQWIEVTVEGKWEGGDLGMVSPNAFMAPQSKDGGLLLNPGVIAPGAADLYVEVTNLDTKPRRLPQAYELGAVEEVEEVIPFSETRPNSQPTASSMARVMAAVSRGKSVGPENLVTDETEQPEGAGAEPPRATGSTTPAFNPNVVFNDGKGKPTDENVRAFVEALQQPDDALLGEHLQSQMDSLPEQIQGTERKQVRAVLVTFQDVFTDPSGQLGKPGVITHTIDTGAQADGRRSADRRSIPRTHRVQGGNPMRPGQIGSCQQLATPSERDGGAKLSRFRNLLP